MDSCRRTFIAIASPLDLVQLAHEHKGVPVHTGGTPVVEVIGELTVAAHHEHRLEADASQTVVSARPAVLAQRGFWHRDSSLRGVVEKTHSGRDTRAHYGPGDHHPIVVVDL